MWSEVLYALVAALLLYALVSVVLKAIDPHRDPVAPGATGLSAPDRWDRRRDTRGKVGRVIELRCSRWIAGRCSRLQEWLSLPS